MQIIPENLAPAATRSATSTLKALARRNKKKLLLTLLLVVTENVVYLLYPLLAGFAINAIMEGNALHGLFYAGLVLIMWMIGAARRTMDTRTFARIYAELAVPVILAQRQEARTHSAIAARVTLSRQFVDFFETHLPLLITSTASMCGAVVMLLTLEPWSGLTCLILLSLFAAVLPGWMRQNERLITRLNNRLEREVGFVGRAGEKTLLRHYRFLARMRIHLSNREAWGFLLIGVAAAVLFAVSIALMALKGGLSAGHIYSVMTYLWMFAMSLDDAPALLEKYAQLKEIGKRINTGLV